MSHDSRADDLLKRPEMRYAHLKERTDLDLPEVSLEVAEQIRFH